MMETIKVEKDQLCLEANIVKMGDDILVAITGGDKPHIGCTAISVPRPSLSNTSNISETTSTINLVGHKDDIVANPIAKTLCKALNVPIVVVCGIHFDAMGQEQIDCIISLTPLLANKILNRLEKGENND